MIHTTTATATKNFWFFLFVKKTSLFNILRHNSYRSCLFEEAVRYRLVEAHVLVFVNFREIVDKFAIFFNLRKLFVCVFLFGPNGRPTKLQQNSQMSNQYNFINRIILSKALIARITTILKGKVSSYFLIISKNFICLSLI